MKQLSIVMAIISFSVLISNNANAEWCLGEKKQAVYSYVAQMMHAVEVMMVRILLPVKREKNASQLSFNK